MEEKIDKLNSENYRQWNLRMKGLLNLKDCIDALSYEGDLDAGKLKKDNKCKAIIYLNVDDEHLNIIESCNTAKEIWNVLESMYTKYDSYHSILLLKEYVNEIKKPDDSVNEYLSRRDNLYKKLENAGFKFDVKVRIGLALIGLSIEYENFTRNVRLDKDIISMADLKSFLAEEERRLKELQKRQDDCSRINIALNEKENFKFSKTVKNDSQQCYRCNRFGHIARNCYAKNRVKNDTSFNTANKNSEYRQTKNNNISRNKTNLNIETKNCNNAILNAGTENKIITSEDTWILDSGSTDHMSGYRNKFTDFQEIECDIVTAGGNKIKCVGRGNIEIKLDDTCGGGDFIINEVLFVPELKNNILSLSRITEKHLKVSINEKKLTIRNMNNDFIAFGILENNLYKFREAIVYRKLNLLSSDISLWHCRFGHANQKEIREILHQQEINVSNRNLNEKCDVCEISNIKVKPFPRQSDTRRSRALDLIHSDVMGPFNTISRGGNKYVVTFIDDFSRYTEIYFIKNKDEVFDVFRQYQKKVERFHERKIKELRSDNGGEYVNKNFNEYLKNQGIHRSLTTPDSPQQNGIAERANQTLMNMVRCMMEQSGIDSNMWAEALLTANYIKNRRMTIANNKVTPFERWYNRKPYIKHMKIFGCLAWSKVRGYRMKWQPKGKRFIFLGYDLNAKAYRLWDAESEKIEISRNVCFDETRFPFKEAKSQETTVKINQENRLFTDCDNDTDYDGSASVCSDDINEIDDTDAVANENSSLEILTPPKRENMTQSGRLVRLPKKYNDFEMDEKICEHITKVNKETVNEPKSYREAVNSSEKAEWKNAIKDEIENMLRNDTWTIVQRPANKRILRTMWVFKKKIDENGDIGKFKARLVALGNHQIEGIDYDKTFSPVVMRKTMRHLLALSVIKGYEVHHIDIKGAYLNAEINDEVYIEMPEGYETMKSGINRNRNVCKLNRGLYGLHQSGLLWNKKLDEFLQSEGLARSRSEPCVYYNIEKDLIVTTYVDDLVLHGKIDVINEFKYKIGQVFQVTDLGKARRILSINVNQGENGIISINQKDYIEQILIDFNMENAKPVTTPIEPNAKFIKNDGSIDEKLQKLYQKCIGGLLYIGTNTRPDIMFAVTHLSSFSSNPSEEHWKALKRILRYLRGTTDVGIIYRNNINELETYTDSDWGSDVNDRKSYSGFLIKLAGGAVSWFCRKQRSIALSTLEAEFYALCECAREYNWMTNFYNELHIKQDVEGFGIINIDNQGAKHVAENETTSDRSKHISIRYLRVRDDIKSGLFHLEYVESDKNLADIMTKGLTGARLQRISVMCGINGIPWTPSLQGEC